MDVINSNCKAGRALWPPLPGAPVRLINKFDRRLFYGVVEYFLSPFRGTMKVMKIEHPDYNQIDVPSAGSIDATKTIIPGDDWCYADSRSPAPGMKGGAYNQFGSMSPYTNMLGLYGNAPYAGQFYVGPFFQGMNALTMGDYGLRSIEHPNYVDYLRKIPQRYRLATDNSNSLITANVTAEVMYMLKEVSKVARSEMKNNDKNKEGIRSVYGKIETISTFTGNLRDATREKILGTVNSMSKRLYRGRDDKVYNNHDITVQDIISDREYEIAEGAKIIEWVYENLIQTTPEGSRDYESRFADLGVLPLFGQIYMARGGTFESIVESEYITFAHLFDDETKKMVGVKYDIEYEDGTINANEQVQLYETVDLAYELKGQEIKDATKKKLEELINEKRINSEYISKLLNPDVMAPTSKNIAEHMNKRMGELFHDVKKEIIRNITDVSPGEEFERLFDSYLLGQDYLICLQPQPKYLLSILERLIEAWYVDIELTSSIKMVSVTINQWRCRRDAPDNVMLGVLPSITIYPRYGDRCASNILSRLSLFLMPVQDTAWTGNDPDYFQRLTDLIYYTNITDAVKAKIRDVDSGRKNAEALLEQEEPNPNRSSTIKFSQKLVHHYPAKNVNRNKLFYEASNDIMKRRSELLANLEKTEQRKPTERLSIDYTNPLSKRS
jgi:hypothetical protein